MTFTQRTTLLLLIIFRRHLKLCRVCKKKKKNTRTNTNAYTIRPFVSIYIHVTILHTPAKSNAFSRFYCFSRYYYILNYVHTRYSWYTRFCSYDCVLRFRFVFALNRIKATATEIYGYVCSHFTRIRRRSIHDDIRALDPCCVVHSFSPPCVFSRLQSKRDKFYFLKCFEAFARINSIQE